MCTVDQALCFNCAFKRPRFTHEGRELFHGICRNILSPRVEDTVFDFESCGFHSKFYDMTLDTHIVTDSGHVNVG